MGSAIGMLAGCLSNDFTDPDATRPNGTESDTSESGEVEYEQCGMSYVNASELPQAAEEEVKAVFDEGAYETKDDLILPQVIDITESYITTSEPIVYYTAEVEEEEDTNRLLLHEEFPETNPLMVGNETEEDVTYDIHLEYVAEINDEADFETEGEVLFEERVEVEAESEGVELNDDVDYRFGTYRAAVEVIELEMEEEFIWEMYDEYANQGYINLDAEGNLRHMGQSESDYGVGGPPCEWNDEGELT